MFDVNNLNENISHLLILYFYKPLHIRRLLKNYWYAPNECNPKVVLPNLILCLYYVILDDILDDIILQIVT